MKLFVFYKKNAFIKNKILEILKTFGTFATLVCFRKERFTIHCIERCNICLVIQNLL